jgi:hypothetical protein
LHEAARSSAGHSMIMIHALRLSAEPCDMSTPLG